MIDRKQIHIQEQMERPVAAGSPEIVDGAFLVEVIEGGLAKVKIAASVSSGDKIAGMAITPYLMPSDAVSNEQFTVPSSGSLIFSLRNNNVVASSARAAVVGGSDLTVDESSFSSTPSTGTVKLDLAGGRIKFAAGDAGKVVKFIYRYNLTVTQARQKFAERSINNRDLVGNLGLVGCAKGYIEVSTDQYDTAVDWSAATSIKLAANGKLTDHTGSGAVVPGARVLQVPDLSGTVQGAFLRISALIP